MGILCDLFVALEAEAPHYEDRLDDEELLRRFERVPLGGLTQLEFEMLWAITEGRPWSPQTHSFEWVGEPPEGDAESWLFRFPTVFVERLVKLTDAEIAALTAQWAQTEGLGCSVDEIRPVVSSLIDLARSAVASRRGLFLWGCL